VTIRPPRAQIWDLQLSAATTYYVVVSGWGNETGRYIFTMTSPQHTAAPTPAPPTTAWAPSWVLSQAPSVLPSQAPSVVPSQAPSVVPSQAPSVVPSHEQSSDYDSESSDLGMPPPCPPHTLSTLHGRPWCATS
jgi:hypothetical protein